MRVAVDRRISKGSLLSLRSFGFEPVLMPPSPLLQPGVASHTDMLIFIGFGGIFCHTSYYEANRELINELAGDKYTVYVSHEQMSSDYPSDVLFNGCILGKHLICNTKTISRLILDAAENNGYNILHVPQGYTKCSICIVDANALITSDRAIARICSNIGIDVLTVSEGHISLPPYSYGFIGGAGGSCGESVYFCGSLDKHPDGEAIKNFCKKYGKSAISLSDEQLLDVGSLYFIE